LFHVVATLVAERVSKTGGRISAKRLLPAARAAFNLLARPPSTAAARRS
jgi:hypothetical protein